MSYKKYLIAFDFEKTIIPTSVFRSLFNLVGQETTSKLRSQNPNFLDFCEHLCTELKSKKIKYSDIQTTLKPIQLTPGFDDLFVYLNRENVDLIIISATFDCIINEILINHNLGHIFKKIIAHRTFITDDFINFDRSGSIVSDCCKYGLCKGVALEKEMKKKSYDSIYFVGDGLNDYCASRNLSENDILFVRKDFDLYNKLISDCSYKKSRVIPWSSGDEIINYIKF
jgi:pyridoxal phosphate phosphatase PHOSPHO2